MGTDVFRDGLLADIAQAGIRLHNHTHASVAWGIPNGQARSNAHIEQSLYTLDRVFVLDIEARIQSTHGPSVQHNWTVKASSIEVAWRLLAEGHYEQRSSQMNDAVVRKNYVDGSSRFVQGSAYD